MNATRERKPLGAVHGSCRWLVLPTVHRAGVLSIGESVYLVEVRHGIRLTRQGDTRHAEAVYDLPADLSACDCPDSVYAAERPGGCKHRRALGVALAALGTDQARGALLF